ncbi:hypothetical protein PhCBS80983_g02023 [Powellomyces hirtus]|uniref:Very-long-chain 3-oxoacyl-CoA reductase n=1 Tax=Powellomyces hirtus TaxID=109895 RepID=A0A507EA22_9FUNG|nr:hypothetical protein PhCBS80983_g02023 [Powellomyces hirtus]
MVSTSCITHTLLGTDFPRLNLLTLSSVLGLLLLTKLTLSFTGVIYRAYLRPATDLRKYGAKQGAYAVVTGASDGIGKEFALQLAKKGFNLILMARTKSKLDEVANQAKALGVTAVVHPFDFANAKEETYAELNAVLAKHEIGVLVNNVAVNHEIPIAFADESATLLRDIVEVDIAAQVRLTRTILPTMLAHKRGLILNVGSVAGLVPSPYLATYSGAKAFFRTWSRALAVECRPKNVHVQHVKTYFVQTAMSKIRKASFIAPAPKHYVASVLKSAGQDTDDAPYPAHALLTWALETLVPESIAIKKSGDMHVDIRKRALRKKERLAKSQ